MNMAKETKFKWLGQRTMARSKGGVSGLTMDTGHYYDIADVDPEVLAEWVRTGNAILVDTSKATDTKLKVQSC
jgi:hypothetical protein